LILGVDQHVTVGSLSDGPQMRRNFISPLAKVKLDYSGGVDWKPFVRVDNNTEKTRVGVDQLGLVSGFQIVKDRSIIEKGQVSHVVTFLKLWWIDLSNLLGLEGLFLYFEWKQHINFSLFYFNSTIIVKLLFHCVF